MRQVYGRDGSRLVRWRTCCAEFSERRGSALCNSQLPEAKAEASITHLDEGGSVRSTARLVQGWKATVARLVRVAGRPAARFHDAPVHDLRPLAWEFDEQGRWGKKRKNAAGLRHGMPRVTGGTTPLWLLPASKLVGSFRVGKRPYAPTLALGPDAKSRLRQGHFPAMGTDAWASYESALWAVFGRRYPKKSWGARPVIRWRQGWA
jgi:hypothetical protein